MTAILDRCIALERTAQSIYELLAERFAGDRSLSEFWKSMAADERAHARNLEDWRLLAKSEPPAERTQLEGFGEDVDELEELLAEAREEAENARTVEEAFAIALKLETSELDAVYSALLGFSPLTRKPDLTRSKLHGLVTHHRALVHAVRQRSRDEHNLTMAALLAARD